MRKFINDSSVDVGLAEFKTELINSFYELIESNDLKSEKVPLPDSVLCEKIWRADKKKFMQFTILEVSEYEMDFSVKYNAITSNGKLCIFDGEATFHTYARIKERLLSLLSQGLDEI